ncbi:galactoside alpha-(1,2)-fucosyltransferase 2-like [Saccostrea cucullata]|uniref:galactoside alpha-(1,2)-fucosyltransferase 2-like n=1 Tax=Saccostrea cuccullata TaxID=36930 RepID=UPI002ED00919
MKRTNFTYDNSRAVACVNFKGGLGNLMWQYAFLYVLAKTKGLYPIIPVNFKLLDVFNVQPTTIQKTPKRYKTCSQLPRHGERWGLSYDEDLVKVPSHTNVKYDGYFQSWKYWIKFEDEIRDIFQFNDSMKESASSQFGDILQEMNFDRKGVVVGVHVRRGDYATKGHKKYGKLTPNATYYKNAITYFRKRFQNVLFILSSDEIWWPIKVLESETDIYYVRGNSAAEDMALLSLANHTIMSVGTYGWWIGWITRGITVYYKHIFVPGSEFAKEFRNNSIEDFIYPGWIGME